MSRIATFARTVCPSFFLLLGVVIGLAGTSPALATTYTWDIVPGTVGPGNGTITDGSGTWDLTNGNWTSDGGANNVVWPNNTTDVANFNGAVGGTITLGTSLSAGQLAFGGANAYTLVGTGSPTLTLGTSGISDNGPALTFANSLGLSLSGNQAWTNNNTVAANVLTVNSVVSGTGNLTITGNGNTTLSGINTYVGSTVIQGGAGSTTVTPTIMISGTHTTDSGNSFSVLGRLTSTNSNFVTVNLSGTETINGGGHFFMQGGSASVGRGVLNLTGTLNLNGTGTGGGNGAGANAIGFNGGTSILNIGTLSTAGTVNVTNGDFRIGDSTSSSTIGFVNLNNGSLTLDNLDATSTAFVLANGNGGSGTFNLNGGTLTTGRAITGAQNATTGVLPNTFNFNGGTLKATLDSSNFLNLTTTGNTHSSPNVNVGSVGTLSPDGISTGHNTAYATGGAVIDTNSHAITIVPVLKHNTSSGGTAAIDGGLTVLDSTNTSGTLTLTAANTYTGPTTVKSGTLKITGSLANNGPDKVFVAAGADFSSAAIVRNVATGGGSYAGLGSTSIGSAPGLVGTSAVVLAGLNSGAFTGGAASVSMAWRTRSAQEAAAPPLVSDVVNLTGMTSGADPSQTDPFALQMTYSPSLLGDLVANEVAKGNLYLGWLNPNGGSPQWQNAIAGDTGNNATPSEQNFQGTFASFQTANGTNLSSYVGAWGVDTGSNNVWAVVNHNSQFAVVPEPSSLVLAGLGGFGILLIRRRRSVQARNQQRANGR